MSQRILPARDYVKPEAEDAETQAEWEAAQRIHRLMATPAPWEAPSAPYDCEKL